MNSHRFFFCTFAYALSLVCAVGAQAQQSKAPEPDAPATAAQPAAQAVPGTAVPHEVKFSATLRDASGKAMTGTLAVTFALYNQQEGGTPIWSETQNVEADATGHYSVLLGSASSAGVSADLFTSGEGRWLGVRVLAPGEVEQPRVRWVSVPYALKAADAETLGGMPASSYYLLPNAASGGKTAAGASSNAPVPVPLTGSGTAGYISEFSALAVLIDSPLFDINGSIGLGTTTPKSTLDVNGTITSEGNLALPKTKSGTVGVLTMGGAPFLHNFGAGNTFAGDSAGNMTLTGTANAAFGFHALHANSTGTDNSAFGSRTLAGNMAGSENAGFGTNALLNNLTGNFNSAFGVGALSTDTAGNSNSAFGYRALRFNTAGGNSAFGANALTANTSGTNNTAAGFGALSTNTTGADDVAVGVGALGKNTTGQRNAAFGSSALHANNTTSDNSAFGYQALENNTTAFNSAFGSGALAADTTGDQNSAFGAQALNSNTTGQFNAAFGTFALGNNKGGKFNSAFGYQALNFNGGGQQNSAFGSNALFTNTSGTDNSAFGFGSLLANSSGVDNSALGASALHDNSTGVANSAVGSNALLHNTTGQENAAVGTGALSTNTAGSANSAFGIRALRFSTDSFNTALGRDALTNLASGGSNIAIGDSAGKNLTSGHNNVYLGNPGQASESNTIRLGSFSQQNVFIPAIGHTFFINGTPLQGDPRTGQIGFAGSSRRFKHEIADMGGETELLMKLRPVSFYYRPELDETQTRQYGLVAEEVAQVAPQLVVFDQDGAPLMVRYEFINAMLLNEVQKQRQLLAEQHKANEQQQGTIARQQAEIQDLAARLARLEAALAPPAP
jgi:trimeric autotransporter adhesin